jgi:predicted GIY-YIG superfamily endonuclease
MKNNQLLYNEMPDYSKGLIYKISSNGKTYYGSTVLSLKRRMWAHKGNYKQWKNGEGRGCASFKLFDEYGFENCQIELVELYPCASSVELLIREDFYMDNNECINEQRAHTSEEQVKEQKKQWQEVHKEENSKRRGQRYQDNKEEISIKNKELIVCECGRTVCSGALTKHKKTAVHIDFIKNLTI